MKGIVLCEFLEFVEQQFSPDIVDDIIEASELPSEGAYTTVGTYDHRELLKLVNSLDQITKLSKVELVYSFGQYLFGSFIVAQPAVQEGIDSPFTFLSRVQDYIHVDVRKLYPDAELPVFEYEYPNHDQMIMTYKSKCPFADLAHGMIAACIDHFGGDIEVARQDPQQGNATSASFILSRKS